MKLTAYDINKINDRRFMYEKSKNQKALEEFVDSGETCVKVEDWTNKNASSCQSSLMYSIKRFNMKDRIKVVIRKGEVFLVRIDILKEQ